jgi:hypothetical protein
MALFTLGTAFIAHHFWTMFGDDRVANMTEFFKNMSIIAGLQLLSLTGPGKYSGPKEVCRLAAMPELEVQFFLGSSTQRAQGSWSDSPNQRYS